MAASRSSLWMGLAALAGAGGLIVFGATRERPPAVMTACTDGFVVPWDDARARDVELALSATAAPFAATMLATVRADLDRYTETLTTARAQACTPTQGSVATSDAARNDVLACLDRRAARLDAVVDVLAQLDATTVSGAWSASRALGTIEECGASKTPALDPTLARSLDLAAAWVALGAADPAQAHLDTVAVGDSDPHRARALLISGQVLALRNDADAEAKLESAVWAGTAADQPDVVLDATLALADWVSRTTDRHDDAQRWWKLAAAAQTRLGIAESRQFELLLTEATLLRRADKARPAVAVYEAALVLGERALGAEHPRLAEGLLGAALVALKLGKRQSADTMAERALELTSKALGASHPAVVESTRTFGSALSGVASDDAAARWLARAAESAATDAASDEAAELWLETGRAYLAGGKFSEAESALERADRWIESHRPNDALLVQIELVRAAVSRLASETDAARRHYETALAILDRIDPPLPEASAGVQLELASLLADTDALEDARSHLEAAVETLTIALGPADPRVADAWLALADLELRASNGAAALALSRAALKVIARQRGAEHPSVLVALTQLGTACLAEDRNPEAVASLLRATGVAEATQAAPDRRASIELSLATAQWRVGAKDDAIEAATRAHGRVAPLADPNGTVTVQQIASWFERRGLEVPALGG